jgi:hypothetical protein
MKKIKIKPAPSSKRRNARQANVSAETNEPQKIHIDENSHSSCEDKTEFNDDHNNPNSYNPNKKATVAGGPQKRSINAGLGGFNLRFRSRAKMQQNDDQNLENPDNKSSSNKRKKKVTVEDMIPAYMQEAFFGSLTLANSNDLDLTGVDDSAERIEFENRKITKDQHKISLDENMLKLAQQKKAGHLELGIEGTFYFIHIFLRGFFSPNRI